MKRMAIALGLVAMAATARAAAPDRSDPDKPYEPIQVGDWSFVGNSDVTLLFIKPGDAPAGAGFLRVQVRFEDATPMTRQGFAFLSSTEIDDVDCRGRQTRVVQVIRYAGRNLSGHKEVEDVADPAWKMEATGSFGAGIIRAACMPETLNNRPGSAPALPS